MQEFIKSSRIKEQVTLLLMILALSSQIWYLIDHSRVNPDEAFSLRRASSFLEGKGLTYQSARGQDLAEIIYVNDQRYPPGRPINLAAILWIIKSPGTADLILEVFAATLFFLSWYWLLRIHKNIISFWRRVFIWVFWIFFPVPLMGAALTAHTTDNLSLAFFSLSIVIASILISEKNKWKIIFFSTLVGILTGINATLRYLYWPLLAVVPIAIIIFGLVKRNLKLLLYAIPINILISSLFILAISLFNLETSGHLIGYKMDLFGEIKPRLPNSQGLRWEHLERIIPFPMFTFGISDPSFLATRDGFIEYPPFLSIPVGLSWLFSGIVVLAFAYYIWHTLPIRNYLFWLNLKSRVINADEKIEIFSLAGLITIILVGFTLAYLSITMELHPFGGGWVPVMELRYYSITYVFFTLGVGYLSDQTRSRAKFIRYCSHIVNMMAFAFFVLVVVWRVQIGYQQLYFPEKYFTGAERFAREIMLFSLLEDEILHEYPVVVVYPESDTNIRRKTLERGFILAPLESIPPNPALSTSNTVNALLVYRDSEPDSTKKYFENLVNEFQGICVDRGNFRGCHILLTP